MARVVSSLCTAPLRSVNLTRTETVASPRMVLPLLHQAPLPGGRALVVGAVFVVLVVEQLLHWVRGRGTFSTSVMWIKTTWLYKALFVAVVVALMKLVQCVPMEPANAWWRTAIQARAGIRTCSAG